MTEENFKIPNTAGLDSEKQEPVQGSASVSIASNAVELARSRLSDSSNDIAVAEDQTNQEKSSPENTPLEPAVSPKYEFGISPPFSTKPASEKELRSSQDLRIALSDAGLFEAQEETNKRIEVLEKLDVIVSEWIRIVCRQKGYMTNGIHSKIFTFGSYRLGVHSAGADIDTLCVTSRVGDRRAFFVDLYKLLASNPQVTQLNPVPEAYVPVIKFVFDGIPIDLLFARLDLPSLPSDLQLSDDAYLRGLERACVLSLNGCRVTDAILRLVPNKEVFRTSLRCIKYWGKKRGVYGNVVGYLGGVAWAILTARVCQLYPNASSSTIITKFFQLWTVWDWPQPVYLTFVQDCGFGHTQWNPKVNPRDKLHLMPVITPVYPQMNSTYNVSSSTLNVMKTEFARGKEITDKIQKGLASWGNLFEERKFFEAYRVYMQIGVWGASESSHRAWVGWVESRLRILIGNLEQTEGVLYAHPYPEYFCNKDTDHKYYTSFFAGLVFEKRKRGDRRQIDLTEAVSNFTLGVLSFRGYTDDLGIRADYITRAKLPDYVKRKEAGPASMKQSNAIAYGGKPELVNIIGRNSTKRSRDRNATSAAKWTPKRQKVE